MYFLTSKWASWLAKLIIWQVNEYNDMQSLFNVLLDKHMSIVTCKTYLMTMMYLMSTMMYLMSTMMHKVYAMCFLISTWASWHAKVTWMQVIEYHDVKSIYNLLLDKHTSLMTCKIYFMTSKWVPWCKEFMLCAY